MTAYELFSKWYTIKKKLQLTFQVWHNQDGENYGKNTLMRRE